MGITCKPIGKYQGIIPKVENELESQKKVAKEKKNVNESGKNEKSK